VIPALSDLPENLQKILNPQNAKMLSAIASGAAPLPGRVLVEAWICLIKGQDQALSAASLKSLQNYPEKMLLGVIQAELSSWALGILAEIFSSREMALEAILLNNDTPDQTFVDSSRSCSEKLAQLIGNNQERLIQAPAIVPALESNPHNLKSSTDRIRHFLQLAGIFIPGDKPVSAEEKQVDLSILDEPTTGDGSEKIDERVEKARKAASNLTEDQRLSLTNYIARLNVGGKMKLAMKGNKEARQILIRDVNAIVATSVLKSPRISELEVAAYSRLRNVCDDVIRIIATSPQFTKAYEVKLAICLHSKSPLQQAMGFLKFLTYRDLAKVSKDRNILMPVKKAAKELVELKRK